MNVRAAPSGAAAKVPLTFACGLYDRMLRLYTGEVQPRADMDEIDDVFGGDPWPYGIEANRPTLEALVQYMVEQHFIPARIAIEDLFVVGH